MKGGVPVDIRPIAIGEILRRITAKYLCLVNRKMFLQHLAPIQLGVGARCGMESIIHSVRLELEVADSDYVLFQVDFRNAFNNISRRHFLDIVKSDFPDIYNLAFVTEIFQIFNGFTSFTQKLAPNKGILWGHYSLPLFCTALFK